MAVHPVFTKTMFAKTAVAILVATVVAGCSVSPSRLVTMMSWRMRLRTKPY